MEIWYRVAGDAEARFHRRVDATTERWLGEEVFVTLATACGRAFIAPLGAHLGVELRAEPHVRAEGCTDCLHPARAAAATSRAVRPKTAPRGH